MARKPQKVLTPLEKTQEVLDISATERSTFKTCRRRWELQVLENLQPVIPPTFEYEFGAGIHRALEAYYFNVANIPAYPDAKETYERPLEGALTAWDDWYQETDKRFATAKEYDSEIIDQALNKLVELADLGEEMLRGYHRYSDEHDDFTIHAIEGMLTPAGQSWLKKHWEDREHIADNSKNGVTYHEPSRRLLVPILNPKTQLPAPGNPVLSCRLDLVVNKIDPGNRGIWIYDHKSAASIPSDRGMDFDDQVTSYLYTYWRWLGIIPRGFCFNLLAKQIPKPPRILKNGSLSTAKDQLTTADAYREELIKQGLMLKDGTVTSEEHEHAYEALLSHGWDRFFDRQYVTRSKLELIHFEQRLFEEWQDMSDCFSGDLSMYPNLSRFHCPNCQVNSICQAIEDGSDYEDIIDHNYMQKPDRKSDMNLSDM